MTQEFPCPQEDCAFVGTSRSGRTRHVQQVHPTRLSALLRADQRPRYPVERPRAQALCVHLWSEGGDVQVLDPSSGRWVWVHVRSCKRCPATEEVRPTMECDPTNCNTQRRLLYGK